MKESSQPRLCVNVVEARGLKAMDLGKSSDPFVVIQVGDKILQTSVQRRSLNPVWNETFVFPGSSLAQLYGETLLLTIVDKDFSLLSKATGATEQGDLLGALKVPLSRIAIGEEIDLWFELEDADDGSGDRVSGQLHLVLQLEGPFRTEFRLLQQAGFHVAQLTDRVLDGAYSGSVAAKPYVLNRYTIAASVPLIAGLVACAPLLGLALTIGLPLLLPVLLLAALMVLGVALVSSALALSSRPGRQRAMGVLHPVLNKLRDTPVGQQLLYNTGARPSLTSVVETFMPQDQWKKLYASLIIDAIGSSSYAIPLLGESGDLAWAPTQAMLVAAMYGRSSPYAAYFSFAEEMLPFTDIVPTATLAWLRQYGPEVVEEWKVKLSERRQQRLAQETSRPEITAADS